MWRFIKFVIMGNVILLESVFADLAEKHAKNPEPLTFWGVIAALIALSFIF